MKGPYTVHLRGVNGVITTEVDADSFGSSDKGGVMLFWKGDRLAYVAGLSQLLDVTGPLETEEELEQKRAAALREAEAQVEALQAAARAQAPKPKPAVEDVRTGQYL